MGIGESGLNASLAISEAVAPSAPLKMASLFIAGMVTSIDFLTIVAGKPAPRPRPYRPSINVAWLIAALDSR